MNKSKYELPAYFAFYNAALSTYTNAVLNANALMLEYGVAATRTMLRATALAAPVAPATTPDGHDVDAIVTSIDPINNELARFEASLYADETEPLATDSTAIAQAAANLLEDSPQATVSARPKRSKKAALRRRGGKK